MFQGEKVTENICKDSYPKLDWGDITEEEGALYYRYDFPSCDSREQWDNYTDTIDMLGRFGFGLSDYCLEHDCLTGDLVKMKRPESYHDMTHIGKVIQVLNSECVEYGVAGDQENITKYAKLSGYVKEGLDEYYRIMKTYES